MRVPTLAAAALCLCFGAADAESSRTTSVYSGLWLHSAYLSYRAESDSAEAMAYAAYVSGMVDMALLADRYGTKKRLLCPPLDTPMREYLDAVGRHLDEHAEDLPNHRAYLVISALQAKFGCESEARPASRARAAVQ